MDRLMASTKAMDHLTMGLNMDSMDLIMVKIGVVIMIAAGEKKTTVGGITGVEIEVVEAEEEECNS